MEWLCDTCLAVGYLVVGYLIVVSRPGSRYTTTQPSLVEAGPIESGLRESSKSFYLFNVVPTGTGECGRLRARGHLNNG